jgi:ribosome-associated protein
MVYLSRWDRSKMPIDELRINDHLLIPGSELRFSYARSSGPGGQNVNKVNSKAVLRWDVVASPGLPDDVRERFMSRYATRVTTGGELVLSSERYRDQAKNVNDCLEKLREMILSVAAAPKRRRRTRPTRTSKIKRLVAKKHKKQRKEWRRSPPVD